MVERVVGQEKKFDFALKPHWELGEKLDIIDFERGVKISGTPLLSAQRGRGQIAACADHLDAGRPHPTARLRRDLSALHGQRECLVGTGQLPKFADNVYQDTEEDFWLMPTAEVPVTNMYREEILDGASLPVIPRGLHRLLPAGEDVGRQGRPGHQAGPPVRQGGAGQVRPAGERRTRNWTS